MGDRGLNLAACSSCYAIKLEAHDALDDARNAEP